MNAVSGVPRTYELTVSGAIGPVLSAAFPAHRVMAGLPGTVLVVADPRGRQLDEILEILTVADVTVREIRRLP